MAQRCDSPTASSPQFSLIQVIEAAIPSTIMSCRKRHSCFIASHRALACSRSPASIASMALSIVGRDISSSSSSENQRSVIWPPMGRVAGSLPLVDFRPSDRVAELLERIREFMDEHVYPVEQEAHRALDDEVRPGVPYPQVLVDLRERARSEGLW